MTKVINLFGGPGSGKSTLASEIFVKLKRQGKSVELVREYAKDWAWDNRPIETYFQQFYIMGKQVRRESMLYGLVDYVVTDSPFALSGFYAEHYLKDTTLTDMTSILLQTARAAGITHKHFRVPRNKPYVAAGRYQTAEGAQALDTLQELYFAKHWHSDTLVLVGQDDHLADHILQLMEQL